METGALRDDIPGGRFYQITICTDAITIKTGEPCLCQDHTALGGNLHPAKALFVIAVAATTFDQPASQIILSGVVAFACSEKQIFPRLLFIFCDFVSAIGVNLADCIFCIRQFCCSSLFKPWEGLINSCLAGCLHHDELAVIELCHSIAAFGSFLHQLSGLGGIFLNVSALKQQGGVTKLRFVNAIFCGLGIPFGSLLLIGRHTQPTGIDFSDKRLRCWVTFFSLWLGEIEGRQIKSALIGAKSFIGRFIAEPAWIDVRQSVCRRWLRQHLWLFRRLVAFTVMLFLSACRFACSHCSRDGRDKDQSRGEKNSALHGGVQNLGGFSFRNEGHFHQEGGWLPLRPLQDLLLQRLRGQGLQNQHRSVMLQ